MWKTSDGKNLKLLRSDLRRISFRMRRRKRRRLDPASLPEEPDFSLVGPLGRLARRARQVGVLRRPQCDCAYPVFASSLGRRQYRLLARPLPGGGNAIVSVRVVLRGR